MSDSATFALFFAESTNELNNKVKNPTFKSFRNVLFLSTHIFLPKLQHL
jgi:hypothetical protein